MNRWVRVGRLACLLVACVPAATGAQTLPSAPIVLADGVVTLGGDVTAAFAPEDVGFFNYSDYGHSALRVLRLDLMGTLRAGRHVSFLGELRSENAARPKPYAFYVRVRPWVARAIDIQVGRVPPTFGAFARRTYAADNPLIGSPLAYQYLTSLRPDSVPATADELLGMRGRGWKSNFSTGNTKAAHGLPLASALEWDTGIQAHAATDVVDMTASMTTGTISNPLFRDDNSGRQLAGRVAVRPAVGLVIGVSAARGPFLTAGAVRSLPGNGHDTAFTQTAWGGDVEYSRDYYLVRAETIVSDWRLPIVAAPVIDRPLRAVGTSLEGRYKIAPGLYAAARFDHLGFNTITGSAGPQTWDAPVTRIEAGGGYSLQRNLLLKASFQHNTRDTPRFGTANLVSIEVVFWF